MTTLTDLIEKYRLHSQRVRPWSPAVADQLQEVVIDLENLIQQPAPVTSQMIGAFVDALWQEMVESTQNSGVSEATLRRMRHEWLKNWRRRAGRLLTVVAEYQARLGKMWVAQQRNQGDSIESTHQHEEPK